MTEATPSAENQASWTPWGFWATAGLGLAVVGVYLVASLLVVFAVSRFAFSSLGVQPNSDAFDIVNSPTMLISTSLVSAVIGTVLILLIASRRKGASWLEYLAVHRPATKELFLWLVITVVMVILLGLIGALLERPAVPEFWVEVYGSASVLPLLGLAVIAAPLFEESLFRGFLFRGWSQSKLGATGAIILTAVLFTALHAQYDLFDLGQVLVLGLLLGIARYRSGSLVIPVAMHALTNALAFAQMAFIL